MRPVRSRIERNGLFQDGGDNSMKTVIIAVIVILLLAFTSTTAFAAGGKVHGEKGQGEVVQVQVQDPWGE